MHGSIASSLSAICDQLCGCMIIMIMNWQEDRQFISVLSIQRDLADGLFLACCSYAECGQADQRAGQPEPTTKGSMVLHRCGQRRRRARVCVTKAGAISHDIRVPVVVFAGERTTATAATMASASPPASAPAESLSESEKSLTGSESEQPTGMSEADHGAAEEWLLKDQRRCAWPRRSPTRHNTCFHKPAPSPLCPGSAAREIPVPRVFRLNGFCSRIDLELRVVMRHRLVSEDTAGVKNVLQRLLETMLAQPRPAWYLGSEYEDGWSSCEDGTYYTTSTELSSHSVSLDSLTESLSAMMSGLAGEAATEGASDRENLFPPSTYVRRSAVAPDPVNEATSTTQHRVQRCFSGTTDGEEGEVPVETALSRDLQRLSAQVGSSTC